MFCLKKIPSHSSVSANWETEQGFLLPASLFPGNSGKKITNVTMETGKEPHRWRRWRRETRTAGILRQNQWRTWSIAKVWLKDHLVSLESWAGRELKWGSELGDPDRTMWTSLDGVTRGLCSSGLLTLWGDEVTGGWRAREENMGNMGALNDNGGKDTWTLHRVRKCVPLWICFLLPGTWEGSKPTSPRSNTPRGCLRALRPEFQRRPTPPPEPLNLKETSSQNPQGPSTQPWGTEPSLELTPQTHICTHTHTVKTVLRTPLYKPAFSG